MSRLPFNVSLLKLDPGQLRLLNPIETLDRYDAPNSTNFHENGLFSTEIFGRVGERRRDTTFAKIALKTTILHPIIYQRLERLKRLYTGILTGKEYAVWDEMEKDFVKAGELDGQTGYHFFMSHWDELEPRVGESAIRQRRVELVNKYRQEAKIDNILVLPAGLRDAEIDNLGRTQEDEINDHYRRLLSIANTIPNSSRDDGGTLNTARMGMQNAFNQIYHSIEGLLVGKKGFIQDKWGSRNVINGTRNVLSAMDVSAPTLEAKNYPGPDDTVMGLWQVSRGALPITQERLMAFLNPILGSVEGSARLIDTKTLKSEAVGISAQTYDRWATMEGLEKVIAGQSMVEFRRRPVIIEGRYLALVYKPKDRAVFKVFSNIDDLPDDFDKKDVHPLTHHELIYLSNYRHWNDLRVITTRYPVTGEGSTYVSRVFLRTTVKSEERVELGHDWEPLPEEDNTAYVYPVFDPEAYVDTSQVHPYRMAGLGADFDGDTVSNNIVYTQEAVTEIDKYLNSPSAHVDPAGGLRASASIDTVNLVLHNLTGF